MCVHINSVDRKIWQVIENGPIEINMTNEVGATIPKLKALWEENDEKIIAMIRKLKICSYHL